MKEVDDALGYKYKVKIGKIMQNELLISLESFLFGNCDHRK
jgi:hypothetical protein